MARKIEDLSGKRFGHLIVVRKAEKRKSGRVVWECICDCGNTCFVRSSNLTSGSTTSCGCAHKGVNAIDLTGQRFGRLVALEPTEERYCSSIVWKCRCDCGNLVNVSAHHLRQGMKKSCGCLATKSIQNLKREEKNIAGQRFGRLVVTKATEKRKSGRVVWECICDCGNIVNVPITYLTCGDVVSCGCLRKEALTLGKHKLQKSFVFGTNVSLIEKPDEELRKNNTSGVTGVGQVNGAWIAHCMFQGYSFRHRCSSKEEAILVRKILRKKRDEFLSWYNSLSPEEQKKEALAYKYTRKEFVENMRQELMNILNENKIK